ncbi:hypothetical protein [Sphingobium sp. YR768]|uniref:hypothetical protein n=1 Tax=Sphingobium sp. YR768 TaxID=1884365 RepID=UPI0008B8DCE4|nr:hypothetical protein [Sphingobium sp. YR768]SER00641.1 hypothetical protein SAMN05518866_10483 [Sphingobium sp. YR768]
MSKTDPELVKAFLGLETALVALEHMEPQREPDNVLMLAIFTVADDAVYELIDAVSSHRLTSRQQAALRDRVARFEALGTAEIRSSLRRYGCAPAPRRVAN